MKLHLIIQICAVMACLKISNLNFTISNLNFKSVQHPQNIMQLPNLYLNIRLSLLQFHVVFTNKKDMLGVPLCSSRLMLMVTTQIRFCLNRIGDTTTESPPLFLAHGLFMNCDFKQGDGLGFYLIIFVQLTRAGLTLLRQYTFLVIFQVFQGQNCNFQVDIMLYYCSLKMPTKCLGSQEILTIQTFQVSRLH